MNLSAATLLRMWETGSALTAAERPAALLAMFAGETLDAIAHLPLGQRDTRLLQWYCQHAGTRLEALADCPGCREPVELNFDVADVARPASVARAPVVISEDGWVLSWRPPDTRDFCHAASAPTAEGARGLLLDRCLTISSGRENQAPPADLIARLMNLAAAADASSDIQLSLACPACGAEWQAPFDIGAFLWALVQSEALRLLAEVKEIAATCSWSEAEILSLSPARRSAYLQLTRGA